MLARALILVSLAGAGARQRVGLPRPGAILRTGQRAAASFARGWVQTYATNGVSTADLTSDVLRLVELKLEPGKYALEGADQQEMIAAIARLESSASPPTFPGELDKVDGSWDLVFTTNAISLSPSMLSTLGPLSSPLVDVPGLPIRTQSVKQEIDVQSNRVRNVLTIAASPEAGLGAFRLPGPLGDLLAGLESTELTLVLDHRATVEIATSTTSARAAPARLRIELEQVRRLLTAPPGGEGRLDEGLLALVPKETSVDVPFPLGAWGAGRFDTTYVSSSLRVSRGVSPGSELRLFRRSPTPTTVVAEDQSPLPDA